MHSKASRISKAKYFQRVFLAFPTPGFPFLTSFCFHFGAEIGFTLIWVGREAGRRLEKEKSAPVTQSLFFSLSKDICIRAEGNTNTYNPDICFRKTLSNASLQSNSSLQKYIKVLSDTMHY